MNTFLELIYCFSVLNEKNNGEEDSTIEFMSSHNEALGGVPTDLILQGKAASVVALIEEELNETF